MPNVNVRITGDDARVLKSFATMESRVKKLEFRLKELGQTGRAAGTQTARAFDTGAARKFTGFITGSAGLLAGYRLITAELQQHIRLQREAGELQKTLSGARQDLIANLPGRSFGLVQDLISKIGQISSGTGVDEKVITQAITRGVSASSINVPASVAAATQSARFLAQKPDAIAEFTGSLLSTAKATGTNDPRVNQGVLQFTGGLSLISEPRLQAQNIAPGLGQQVALGATLPDAIALFSTLTTETIDTTGRKSKVAAINFLKNTKRFFAQDRTQEIEDLRGQVRGFFADDQEAKRRQFEIESDRLDPNQLERLNIFRVRNRERRRKQAVVRDKLTSLERSEEALRGTEGLFGVPSLAFFQKNPAEASRFLSEFPPEAGALGTITQLLSSPDTQAARSLRENRAAVPGTNDEFAQIADAAIALKGADPLFRIGAEQRIIKNAAVAQATKDLRSGSAGTKREALGELLPATGAGVLETFFQLQTFDIENAFGQRTPKENAIRALEARRRALFNPGFFHGAPREGTPAFERATETAADLTAVIAELRAVNETLGQMNQNTVPPPALVAPDEDR